MYYGEDVAAVMAIMVFYFVFLGVWWLLAGILGHALLNKKGYRHVGLYIMAWIPMLNWMSIFLFVGLPDALLNRKMDYLLRQMAASGLIQAPPMPQPATPQTTVAFGAQQPAYQAAQAPTGPTPGAPQANPFGPQTAPQPAQPVQATWQPPQNQQPSAPVTPESLFGPGSNQNNNGSNS